jgi:hypothetical protein
MRDLVDTAIQETNTAYALSGIDAQLRLAYAYCDVNYIEASSDAFGSALDSITYSANVQALRESVGADMVAKLIDDGQYCGLGWRPGNPSNSPGYMFSVSAWNCATGYYTFGHELVSDEERI